MSEKNIGLYDKYVVSRTDGTPMPEGAIVLEWKDSKAWPAINIFAKSMRAAGYVHLAEDLEAKLKVCYDQHYQDFIKEKVND